MLTSLPGYTESGAIHNVQTVYAVMLSLSYFILVWDWLSNLHNDWVFILKAKSSTHPLLSLKPWFLLSRYCTLFWCTFVVVTYALVGRHPNVCTWFQYYPYGYSIIMLPAHLVMILRLYSVYERSTKILIALLALAVVDFAIQMGVNHLATSILLQNYNETATCFTYPTTAVFSLVFISPVVFHHILLGMTLWKSAEYIKRSGQGVGLNPILHVIRRDHILFTLAICLINFTNLVLSLQPGSFPYKLINQLPAAAFTQIFLAKIVFSLKASAKALDGSHVDVGASPASSGLSKSNGNSSGSGTAVGSGTGTDSNGSRGHKSMYSGATAYDMDIKTSPPASPRGHSRRPSTTKVQLPHTWPIQEEGPTPLTRLPPPVSRTPPFSSLSVRSHTMSDQPHHQRGRSVDEILIGRQMYTVTNGESQEEQHVQEQEPETFLSVIPDLEQSRPVSQGSRIGLAV